MNDGTTEVVASDRCPACGHPAAGPTCQSCGTRMPAEGMVPGPARGTLAGPDAAETSVTAGFAETQLLESFEPPGGGDPDIAALYAGRKRSAEGTKPWPETPWASVQYNAGAAAVPARVAPADPWASAPPAVPERTVPYGAYAIAGIHRSHRRLWLVLGLIMVLLGGGGAAAYVFLRPSGPTAEQVVRDYFADLSTDDTLSALALVDGGGTYADRSAYPFLNEAALARQADRPTGLKVTGTTSTSTSGRSATAVSVTYLVADTTVHQTIVVARPSKTTGGGSSLLLVAPFMHLVVGASAGRGGTVNGIAYPAQTGPGGLLALPGAYAAQVAGTTLLAAASADATYDSGTPGTVRATVSFPPPAAADGAAAAVQSAVNAALSACAQTQSPDPGGCPFQYPDQSATMAWSVTAFPQISLQVGGDGTVRFTDGGHQGSVHYEATTYDLLVFPSTASGDMPFDVSGTASVGHDGKLTVTLASS